MKMNLKRVYTVQGRDGVLRQFGPGVSEVPDEFVDRLKLRGAEVKGPGARAQGSNTKSQADDPVSNQPVP